MKNHMIDYKSAFGLPDSLVKHALPNATAYGHDPKVAPLYYCYVFYNPLTEKEFSEFIETCGFNLTNPLISFYRGCNGLRVNQRLSIYGSLLHRGLQPISLDYANFNERPMGLPDSSTVIGGLTLSYDTNGYLVSHEDGTVTCSSSFLKYDVINKWENIEALIKEEIAKSIN